MAGVHGVVHFKDWPWIKGTTAIQVTIELCYNVNFKCISYVFQLHVYTCFHCTSSVIITDCNLGPNCESACDPIFNFCFLISIIFVFGCHHVSVRVLW